MALPASASDRETPGEALDDPPAAEAMIGSTAGAGEFTRGIGLYPGSPHADFSPAFEIDASMYRDLALWALPFVCTVRPRSRCNRGAGAQ